MLLSCVSDMGQAFGLGGSNSHWGSYGGYSSYLSCTGASGLQSSGFNTPALPGFPTSSSTDLNGQTSAGVAGTHDAFGTGTAVTSSCECSFIFLYVCFVIKIVSRITLLTCKEKRHIIYFNFIFFIFHCITTYLFYVFSLCRNRKKQTEVMNYSVTYKTALCWSAYKHTT